MVLAAMAITAMVAFHSSSVESSEGLALLVEGPRSVAAPLGLSTPEATPPVEDTLEPDPEEVAQGNITRRQPSATTAPTANVPDRTATTTPTPVTAPPPRLPTPTVSAAVPEPSAYFAPSFISAAPATGEGIRWPPLRGRVLDWRRAGVAGLSVRAWNETTSVTVATDTDGSYFFENLPSGIYSVRVEGFQGKVAQNVYLTPTTSVLLEFVESSAVSGTATATATIAAIGTPNAALSGTARVVPTGEGPAAPRRITTPIPTAQTVAAPSPRREASSSILGLGIAWEDFGINLDPWKEAFLMGAGAAYAFALLGLAAAALRR